jgi:hypothetical protein
MLESNRSTFYVQSFLVSFPYKFLVLKCESFFLRKICRKWLLFVAFQVRDDVGSQGLESIQSRGLTSGGKVLHVGGEIAPHDQSALKQCLAKDVDVVSDVRTRLQSQFEAAIHVMSPRSIGS